MTLGRSSTGALKIKTDGGLRAVECACCGGSCQPFLISVLGFSFVTSPVLYTYSGQEPFCYHYKEVTAGNYISWMEGFDYYCDGTGIGEVGGYTGGKLIFAFDHYLQQNVLKNFFVLYTKLLNHSGGDCVFRAFCPSDLGRIADWEVQQAPTGDFTIPVPTASVTYQLPGTITTEHGVCNDYQASTTETSDASISFTISPE